MKFLLKAAVIAGAIMATTSAFAVENVVWWDFLNGGDGVRMKAMIQKFNDEHKGQIEIDGTTLEWGGPFYTKLQTSAAIGQGPDIATYHLSHIPAGVAAGVLTAFDPKELASIGLVASDYPQHAMQAAMVDGKQYAVPFDVHPLVLYYNKKILSDAGLLGPDGKPKGIDTLAGWRDVLDKLTKAGVTAAVFNTGGADQRVVYSLFGQMGGQALSGGKFFQGDNFDKMVAAYNEATDWVNKGWVAAYLDSTFPAKFEGGGAAFMINGVWELPTMVDLVAKGQGFDYGMMPLPDWYTTPANWADSHSFVIPNNVGHPATPDKHAAVLQVIKWMNQNSLLWAGGGHVPAYLPVRNSDAFKALKPNSDYADTAAANAFYEPTSALSGPGDPYEDGWNNYMAGPMNGDGDVKAALGQYRDYLNGLLK